MKNFALFFLIFFLIFFGFLYGLNQKQKLPQPEKHEVTVRLVLVDVIATDKKGNVVTDLTKENFEIYEDGKRVPINSLEFISLETPELGVTEREVIKSPKVPFRKRRFIVIFDSINTIKRVLDRSKSQITERLVSLIKLGREIMVLELGEKGDVRVILPFTSDERLVAQAVHRASGNIWIEKSADVLSTPSILGRAKLGDEPPEVRSILENFQEASRDVYQFEARLRFEKTIDAILAVLNMIKDYPGRKPVLFVSGGIPSLSFAKIFSGKAVDTVIARSEVAAAKVADPFKVLKKSARRGGDEILEDLIRFANSHNITFYSMDPDNYLRYVLPDAAYDNFPRQVGIAEIKKKELSNLKFMALDTGGVTLLGAQKFENFKKTVNRDLASYYELSYYPKRKKADSKYHKIDVKINRPGIKIRFRKGYFDYTREQKESLLFASASSNPSLFNQMLFQARAVPFIQSENRFLLWINMALPVQKLFLGDSGGAESKNLRINMWVEDMDNEKAFSTQVNIPIKLTSSFRNRLRKAKYFGFNMCSQELKFKKDKYHMIFAFYDEKLGEMGTVVQELEIPILKAASEAKITNVVFGRLAPGIKGGASVFSISKRDGTLQLSKHKFFPMGLNNFSQGEKISLFLQVYPSQKEDIFRPQFSLFRNEEELGNVLSEVVDESWNKKANIRNYVFALDFNDFSRGEYVLKIKLTDPSEKEIEEKITIKIM